jgi:hypothetical protein
MRLLLVLVLLACTACATMDPAARRALDAGGFLFYVGFGALSLVSGDPISAAVWFGTAGAGAVGAASRDLPAWDAAPAPPQTVVSER